MLDKERVPDREVLDGRVPDREVLDRVCQTGGGGLDRGGFARQGGVGRGVPDREVLDRGGGVARQGGVGQGVPDWEVLDRGC